MTIVSVPAGCNPFVRLRENARLLLALQSCPDIYGNRTVCIPLSKQTTIEIEQKRGDLIVTVNHTKIGLSHANRWRLTPEVKPIDLNLTGLEMTLDPISRQTERAVVAWIFQTVGVLKSSFTSVHLLLQRSELTYSVRLDCAGAITLACENSAEIFLQIAPNGEIVCFNAEGLAEHLDGLFQPVDCAISA